MIWVILYLLITIGLGIAYCFYGNRIFFPLFAVTMFFVGFAFTTGYLGNDIKGILIGVVVGAIFALISKFLYKVNIFLLGALVGGLIGAIASSYLPDIKFLPTIIIIVLAILLGIVALKLNRIFIIIATAATGAGLISTNVVFLVFNIARLSTYNVGPTGMDTISNLSSYMASTFAGQHTTIIMIASVVLFIIGAIYQSGHKQD